MKVCALVNFLVKLRTQDLLLTKAQVKQVNDLWHNLDYDKLEACSTFAEVIREVQGQGQDFHFSDSGSPEHIKVSKKKKTWCIMDVSLSAFVFSGYSGFLPQQENIQK
jgi:hypothetical protein